MRTSAGQAGCLYKSGRSGPRKPGLSYTYEYDRFGNRWHQNGPNQMSLGFDASNRIVAGSGVSYDAAGNVVSDGTTSYTYDAENRIISVSGTLGTGSYVYDAAGQRVRKTAGGVTVDYVYDLAGRAVVEVNTSGAWTRIEVYAGRHLATYKDGPTGQTYFTHADWLGTERARTAMTGTTPVETCSNLPFGDNQACSGTSVSPLHFTGKERDAETGNDYFGARYYAARMGRWLTPDWSARQEAVPYATLADPQTLNLYAYVGNNPASANDADGHAIHTGWRTGHNKTATSEPVSDFASGPLLGAGTPISTRIFDELFTRLNLDEAGLVPGATQQEPDSQPQAQQSSSVQQLTQAQDAALSNPAFQPETSGQRRTFCNFATVSIARAMGAPLEPLMNPVGWNGKPQPYLANQMARNLAGSPYYREITPQEAQILANQGRFVIGAQPARGHGHVATVRPDAASSGSDPLVANIGRKVGVMRASQSFRASPPVRFYTPR